ncbi:hypothetical protein A3224_04415 [Microbulbifer thermotolerans]|uniref:Uncharacterized protein n=1 Tax=Microbulbifer thermotolerans TaxID=252514 RepID=A0A143HJN7_MICTH|nr:hypothetical protein A3224_04415 [Microbulbifer thermotolerans]
MIAVGARFLDYHPVARSQIMNLEKFTNPSPTAKNFLIASDISTNWRRYAAMDFEEPRSEAAVVAASDRIWWKKLDHRRQVKVIVVDIALG